jgi:hypothetical protein
MVSRGKFGRSCKWGRRNFGFGLWSEVGGGLGGGGGLWGEVVVARFLDFFRKKKFFLKVFQTVENGCKCIGTYVLDAFLHIF